MTVAFNSSCNDGRSPPALLTSRVTAGQIDTAGEKTAGVELCRRGGRDNRPGILLTTLPNDRSATPTLRRNRPLGRLANSPRLPQMTSLMRGNDMEPRRQAEPHAADERIREAHTGKIDIRERA